MIEKRFTRIFTSMLKAFAIVLLPYVMVKDLLNINSEELFISFLILIFIFSLFFIYLEKKILLLQEKIKINYKREKNPHYFFELGEIKHFSEIDIKKYKIFKNFKINGFKRVNIIAGLNNSGKTSLLEAIYFLTTQNDIKAFLEIVKFQNKLEYIEPNWLGEAIREDIKLKATFNNINTEVEILNFETDESIDKNGYVKTFEIHSRVEDNNNSSKVHIYTTKEPEFYYKNIKYLCRSMFKSPYFYNHSDLLESHATSVDKKAMREIIEFIKTIDNKIESIELIEKNGVKRFSVTSSEFEEARDITTYGEGVQRVFEIALAFAYCKNGILLIDELETAIHKSLLRDFTKFLQLFAEKFNVQVFVTSHSKECIDAFVQNGYEDNSELMAYLLEYKNQKLTYRYIDGDRLHDLIDSMDLDIRGEKSD